MTTPNTSRRNAPVRSVMLAVVSLLWLAGCTANTSELKREIGVLLQQTMDEVRQETNRMDTEMARIKSEVVQLRSEVRRVDSKVEGLSSEVGQLGSEVALVQTDVGMNNTSLVDLAVHVNQLDRRLARSERPSQQNGERASRPADGSGGPVGQPGAAAVSSPPEDIAKALKHGMAQQEVLRLFGNPHGMERYLDSVYWYYAEGKLKGQYVRFDATTGYVNGWSTFSPQVFQLDLRTTQGGHVR
jgi:outer membrane murein-binding lipoprotein Lpp